MRTSVRLCWLASALSHRVRIEIHVGNPAVAHLYGECLPQWGDGAVIGVRCREEPDHRQGTDASADYANRHLSTLFQIPSPVAQTWEAHSYRQHPRRPLLQGSQPKVGVMSCALRGQAESPSNLADP
jgi:hypothetical protein